MSATLADDDVIDSKYRIVRFIGKGAFASVYEGVNVRIGRRVAIKVLSEEAVLKPGVVERFEREAQSATRIESDHVVHVFDLGALADGTPYIVMELLEGEDLATRLKKKGALSQDRAAHYVVQALRGLADAHQAGVMHRDIKPENVVLLKAKHGDEVVKIVDFGISKLSKNDGNVSMTQTNAVLGSPSYMSPEQCRGAKHMDHRSDLYSISVVLYELVTAELPHKAETFNELMFQIALEEVKNPLEVKPDLDPELCKIILRGLARDPADRFQTALDYEAALLKWAEDKGLKTESWIGRRSRGFQSATIDGTAPSLSAISTAEGAPSQPTNDNASTTGDRKKNDFSATTAAPVSTLASGTAPGSSKNTLMYAAVAAVVLIGAGAFWSFKHAPSTDATTAGTAASTGLVATPPPLPSETATTPVKTAEPEPLPATASTAVTDGAPDAGAASHATTAGTTRRPTTTTRPAPNSTGAATAATPTTPSTAGSAKTTVEGRTIRTNF